MLSKVKIETTYLIDKVQNLRNERALPRLRFVWFFVCKEVSFWVLYLENYHILILFFSITKKTETIACILQLYNIRVAHKLITTLRRLLANVKDKDNQRTDREQYTRSNSVTARLLTSVKPAETLARNWPDTNKRQKKVTSTITLLNTIYRQNIESTGILRHVLHILQTTINNSLSKAGLLS